MRTPLLETKLYRPGPRPGLVPRPRLSEQLDRGAASKLMLVSAPAGFGKSTLLAEWLAGASASAGERSAAWLSLDPGDNDPVTFWTYVIAALRTVAPGIGANALELLHVAAAAADRAGAHDAAQRPRRDRQRHRAGARRLPRDRLARDPGRDGVPARPPAAAAAPGDRQPGRPAAAAGPAAGARRAGRGPGRRPAVHAGRGRGVPQRGDGPAADGAGRGRAGGTHRGLDRRAAAGGAVDAGTRRRRRVHRRLRRGRPLRRRLPGRGGAAAPARARSATSCCRPRSWTG